MPLPDMGHDMKHGEFTIRRIDVNEHDTRHETFQLVGYLNGDRIRKRFKDRRAAAAEKSRLEVEAANRSADVRAVNTRLTSRQLVEAEAAYHRLGGASLSAAVDWYLSTYRPPTNPKPLGDAVAEYIVARRGVVEAVHLNDVERKLETLKRWFPGATVHDVSGAALIAKMQAQPWAPKTWNNARGVFHTFFAYCAHELRRWAPSNPMALIEAKKVAWGIPKIETAARIADLFAYLETYGGGPRRRGRRGFSCRISRSRRLRDCGRPCLAGKSGKLGSWPTFRARSTWMSA